MHYLQRSLAATGLVLFVGCGGTTGTSAGGPVSSPKTATVAATPDVAFSPFPATIAPGGTVTFAFGSLPHNVYFDPAPGAPADIPGVNVNVRTTRTFATAGTYTYRCRIHPGMKGSIIVSDTTATASSAASNHN
jgi:plastocyanin